MVEKQIQETIDREILEKKLWDIAKKLKEFVDKVFNEDFDEWIDWHIFNDGSYMVTIVLSLNKDYAPMYKDKKSEEIWKKFVEEIESDGGYVEASIEEKRRLILSNINFDEEIDSEHLYVDNFKLEIGIEVKSMEDLEKLERLVERYLLLLI